MQLKFKKNNWPKSILKYKGIFISALFFIPAISSFAQQSYNDIMKQLRFTPPTPEIASLFKFSEVPVDLSSGTPNVSVDLYTINSTSLKHNISLSYHASSIRVNEIASVSGLGWNLNAGGAIMRVSRGKKISNNDYNDGSVRFLDESDMTYQNILKKTDSFYNFQRGMLDIEPDEYSFNADGLSGKFFQDRNHNFITNAKSNIKITRYGLGFKVFNGSGIQYIFDLPQYTDDMGIPLVNNITGLNLTKIISGDSKDTISFEYSNFTLVEPSCSFSYTRLGQIPAKSAPNCNTSFTQNWQQQISLFTISYRNNAVTKINFKGGYILFNYTTREDRRLTSDYLPRISEMKIYTSGNKLIKSYSFLCDIFQSSGSVDILPYISNLLPSIDFSKRLRLYQINEVDPNGQTNPLYKFEYNSYRILPPRFNFSQDYWGFYNGRANTDPIRSRLMTQWGGGQQTIGGANKDPDSSFAKACMLTKMTYPTGGYSNFEYEGNMAGGPTLSGGVRIKAINYYAADNQLSKSEQYSYGIDGTGTQLTAPSILNDDHFYFKSIQICPVPPYCAWIDNLVENIRDQPMSEIGFLSGSPIAYSKVTKSIVDASNNTKLISEFNYDISDLNFQWPGTSTLTGRKNMPINNCWKGARLIKQVDYREMGNKTYSPVRIVRNSYKRLMDTILTFVVVPVFHEDLFSLCMPTGLNIYGFTYISYPLQTQKVEIDTTTEVVYSQQGSDSISKMTIFQYDRYNLDFYVRNILTKNSLNAFDKKELKYPFDLLPDVVSRKMVNRNRLNDVIQETNYSGLQNTSFKPVMKDWFGDSLVLETNYLEQYLNSIKTKNVYTVNTINSSSKVMEFINEAGLTNALLWDSDNKNLVAQVVNAGQPDIAYCSFEDNNKGNWVFSGMPVGDVRGPMGKKVYNLSSGNITKSIIGSSYYIISYWRPTSLSALTIAGTQAGYPVIGRTVNGWRYYEHKITGQITATITGSGSIDELRLYPSAAQMTTYTYEPLIGMSGQCDVNNLITYYEYDGFQRLILVRDQDRNILKKICYNYAGQAENCSVLVNVQKQGSYTRNNCTSCQIGSSVTYTVQAGLYSSSFSQADADQKAQDDVNANGLAYANANGTCSAPVSAPLTGSNAIGTKSFTVVFHNNCTGINYTYTINPGTANVALSPQPLTGNYNVSFTPTGGTGTYLYIVNGFSQYTTLGNILGVDIIASGNQVRIQP